MGRENVCVPVMVSLSNHDRSPFDKPVPRGLEGLRANGMGIFLSLYLCSTAFAESVSFDDPFLKTREQLIDLCVETLAQRLQELNRRPSPLASKEEQLLPSKKDRLLRGIRLHGSLRNETAYRLGSSHEFTKFKNQLLLTQTGTLSEDLRFKATQRLYYDPVYDTTNNFPRSVRSDQRMEFELRDTYLDYSHGPFDLRLGKQQIVWGEAVGLFFADVVNAKDLREFVLPDFDLIRIPQWGVDAEYAGETFHAEFVWLPVPDFNKQGVTGSEFEFPLPLLTKETPFTRKDPPEPGNQFKNGEIGGRLSTLWGGWDLSGFYFHTWDKTPVFFRSNDSGVFNFSPRYKRLNIWGGSFSKEVKDVVLKGELAFNPKSYLPILDPTDADGVVRRDFIDYLLGADYTFFEKWDVNLQFMQRVVFNHSGLLADNEDKIRNSISLWIKTNFLDGKLEPEILFITSLMETDLLLRPKLSYKLSDHWRWRLGADLFEGPSDGTFGRFDRKNRIYSELTYEF